MKVTIIDVCSKLYEAEFCDAEGRKVAQLALILNQFE